MINSFIYYIYCNNIKQHIKKGIFVGDLKKTLSYKELTNSLKKEIVGLSNFTLTDRHLNDLELILNGSFSPLKSFMNKNDYNSVINNSKLANGALWPIPITLDTNKEYLENNNISHNSKISLRDKEGFLIAVLAVEDIWEIDKDKESILVYGTKDKKHPGVKYLYNNIKTHYIGGTLEKVQLPHHYDYQLLRHSPD